MTWVAAGPLTDIPVEGAIVVLLPGGRQVAVFRLHDDRVFAVSNRDPFSRVNVIARGIVGSSDDAATVTSPMHKHVFDLMTGECISDDGPSLGRYTTVVRDGVVSVSQDPE